jgi:hypothetical protein
VKKRRCVQLEKEPKPAGGSYVRQGKAKDTARSIVSFLGPLLCRHDAAEMLLEIVGGVTTSACGKSFSTMMRMM